MSSRWEGIVLGEQAASKEPREHTPTQGEQANIRNAFELLDDRQYQQVERLLLEQQEAAQRNGQIAMVIILAAACQLCLTCRQFQADRRLHQIGFEEAARRERESRLQIQAVLSMLSQLASLETQEKEKQIPDLPSANSGQVELSIKSGESEPDKQSTLIQKVKQLLGLESASRVGKSRVGVDRESEVSEVSPYGQQDTAITLRYLAHELDMLEKTGVSLSSEQKILREIATSLTASRQQKDNTLESITYKFHAFELQQAATKPPEEEEDTRDTNKSLDQEGILAATKDDEEPLTDDGPIEKPITEKAKPVNTQKMAHVRPEDLIADKDFSLPTLAVYCLGPFRVYHNNQLVSPWAGQKGLSIFKYLVANRGEPMSKDVLMDAIWPEADTEAARRNLHQAIYSLRQALRRYDSGFQHILFQNDYYLMNPEMAIWIDFIEFEQQVQIGRNLEEENKLVEATTAYGIAEGLYQGEFLKDDLYEEWSSLQREQIRNSYLEIADHLSAYYAEKGEYSAAIFLCQKILTQDNCSEAAHHRLMQCYLALGQRHLAVRQYHTCRQTLKAELDIAPSKAIVALYMQITASFP